MGGVLNFIFISPFDYRNFHIIFLSETPIYLLENNPLITRSRLVFFTTFIIKILKEFIVLKNYMSKIL